MSAKYTFLAWDTPVKNNGTKLALLQLANNADDNGFSYYSISKMAKACDMSERNFMRKIQDLEEMGVLVVERRANRSSLYTLVGDEMGVTICHLQESQVTNCHAEVTNCHAQGDKLSYDPNSTPKTNPKISRFAEFWDLYDKKTGKDVCERKFNKLKDSDIEKIFETLPRYIASTPDVQYRKNPSTWLNQKCWEDEIPTPQVSSAQRHQEYDHEAARQREIEEIRKGLM